MRTDRPQIKPKHLVITGLAVIIVGVLLSSLLVDAYSTIGSL